MDRAPATDASSVFARLDSNAAKRVARVEARRNDAKLDANPLEDAARCVDAFERARRDVEDALREVTRDAAEARARRGGRRGGERGEGDGEGGAARGQRARRRFGPRDGGVELFLAGVRRASDDAEDGGAQGSSSSARWRA